MTTLARSGWRPSPTICFQEPPPGTTPGVLPPTPASDCEPWVVVGLGAEHANSYFEGTQLAHDMSPRRFVVPFVHCAAAPSQIDYTTVDRPRLYWRRYRPGTAPDARRPEPGRDAACGHRRRRSRRALSSGFEHDVDRSGSGRSRERSDSG
ncbi:MAG: hypothetical protein R3B99_32775 [Polyangiales bacterium]